MKKVHVKRYMKNVNVERYTKNENLLIIAKTDFCSSVFQMLVNYVGLKL